jgi:hypothetical protein
LKQLTPRYINIKVNGNNTQSLKTKNVAIRYRINQELKFLYAKKQQLNKQLYRIHLECATYWNNNWRIIQTSIDANLQQEMNIHYERLNKKLDRLQQSQLQPKYRKRSNHNEKQFYPRVKNLTNIRFTEE